MKFIHLKQTGYRPCFFIIFIAPLLKKWHQETIYCDLSGLSGLNYYGYGKKKGSTPAGNEKYSLQLTRKGVSLCSA